MKTEYCCHKNRDAYTDYYTRQVGGNMDYYRGSVQKGSGLGGIFKSLGRTILPLISKGAKSLGRQFVKTSAHVAKDMLQGKRFKDSVETRGKQAGAEMLDRFLEEPPQNYKKKRLQSTQNSRRRTKRRRKPRDIFDG